MALPVRALVAALERPLDRVEVLARLVGHAGAWRGPAEGAVRRDGKGARRLALQDPAVGLAPSGAQIGYGVDALERREPGNRTRTDAETAGDRGGELAHPAVVVVVYQAQLLALTIDLPVHQVQALAVAQPEAALVMAELHAQHVLVARAALELHAPFGLRHNAPFARRRDGCDHLAQLLRARRGARGKLHAHRVFERREPPVAEIVVVGARRQDDRHQQRAN